MTDRVHDTVVHELSRIAYALEASVRDSEFRFRVLESLNDLREQGRKIMALLDRLEASVAKCTTVTESAVALINGLSAQIKAAGLDQTKLTALTDQLDAKVQSLADDVTENTPAA